MQGFGVGIRLGMTMDDLRQLVGIHPTVAEELTLLQTTKRWVVCVRVVSVQLAPARTSFIVVTEAGFYSSS